MTTVAEMAPPQVDGFGFMPDPQAIGLDRLYLNVRKQTEPSTPDSVLQTPLNPNGIEDGMEVAVAIPYQREGESLERAYVRTGQEYAVFASRDDYVPGSSDNDFLKDHFRIPPPKEALLAEPGESRSAYTLRLREYYIHTAKEDKGFDIGIPEEFSGPGGRYDGHLFQHDSGLLTTGYAASGRKDLVRKTAVNMRSLIERGGFIPNATARFYADRGQIPHFSQIVEQLADLEGPQVLDEFLPALEMEHDWWMSGDPDEAARDPIRSISNVVRMPDGSILNRYASTSRRPRLEAYREDVEFATIAARGLTGQARQNRMEAYYAHVRAGAAEGHDFHAGMTRDGISMHEIEVSNRVQVGLNARLARHEMLLVKAYERRGDVDKAQSTWEHIQARVKSMNTYHWTGKDFRDYNFVNGTHAEPDATMTYPLIAGITSREQDAAVVDAMAEYERPGGVSFTTNPAEDFNWRDKSVWPFTVAEVAGAMACAGQRLGGAKGEEAIARAERITSRFLLGVNVAFNDLLMTPEKIDANDPAMLATGGEYKVVPAFAPTAELVLALERWDPRHPQDGPIGLGRSIARLVIHNN